MASHNKSIDGNDSRNNADNMETRLQEKPLTKSRANERTELYRKWKKKKNNERNVQTKSAKKKTEKKWKENVEKTLASPFSAANCRLLRTAETKWMDRKSVDGKLLRDSRKCASNCEFNVCVASHEFLAFLLWMFFLYKWIYSWRFGVGGSVIVIVNERELCAIYNKRGEALRRIRKYATNTHTHKMNDRTKSITENYVALLAFTLCHVSHDSPTKLARVWDIIRLWIVVIKVVAAVVAARVFFFFSFVVIATQTPAKSFILHFLSYVARIHNKSRPKTRANEWAKDKDRIAKAHSIHFDSHSMKFQRFFLLFFARFHRTEITLALFFSVEW